MTRAPDTSSATKNSPSSSTNSQATATIKLVDVHAHLCDPVFNHDIDSLIHELTQLNLSEVVVNGLEPITNQRTLTLAELYPVIKPAAGIYPLHTVHHLLPPDSPYSQNPFSISDALGDIHGWAQNRKIVAIGECGMDGYHYPETLDEQEKIFHQLIDIAVSSQLPVIVHSRKCESRVMEVLTSREVPKVIFHCYMGKVKAALRGAHEHGWYFSIPAISRRHGGFSKMLATLPPERLLTETDSPYLAPQPGQRNDPRHVTIPIQHLAELRGWTYQQASTQVWNNYCEVFAQ